MYIGEVITLCITAFNEEKNLKDLLGDIEWLLSQHLNLKVVIIDNGSTDDTWNSLNKVIAKLQDRIHIERLTENVGYGGGLTQAIFKSETDLVALLSADRQYPIKNVSQAITEFENLHKNNPKVIVYGNRVSRFDSKINKFVSFAYSKIIKLALGVKANDINGQPKIFSRRILDSTHEMLSNSFFIDAQIMAIGQKRGHDLVPCDTLFVSRKYGMSSWFGRRFEVYFATLKELREFRKKIRKIKL
jgi:glycosyltransferase involved in cell wall biosynthesis